MNHSRSYVAKLILLAFAVLFASSSAPLKAQNVVAKPEVVTKYTAGIATIGDSDSSDGDNSSGIFNVAKNVSPASVMQQAIEHANTLHFLKGTYTFTAPWSSGRSNVRIEADPGATFVLANTSAVGLFDLSGDYVSVQNIKVSVPTWTNSQTVMKFSGKFPRIEYSVADVTASSGNTDATPMTLFEFSSCLQPWFCFNVVHPAKGVRVSKAMNCDGGNFCFNQIRNKVAVGIGATGELPGTDTEYRLMYRGLEFQGGGWFYCDDNRVYDIGTTGAGNQCDKVIYYNQQTTPSGTENGHFSICRNKIEAVAPVRSFIHIAGGAWFICDGNECGYAKDVCTALGTADIVLTSRITDDATTEDTNASYATTNGTVRNNQLHRFTGGHVPPVGGGDDSFGANLYMSRTKNVAVIGNICTLIYGYSAFLIDSTTCTDLAFFENFFVSNDITAEYGIAFIGTAGGNYSFRGNFGRNIGSGVIMPGLTGSDIGYGLLGWKATAKVTITFNTNGTIADSANGLARIKAGNWIWLAQGAGGSGSVAANNLGMRRVTAAAAGGGSITVEPAPGTTDGSAGESVDIFLLDGNPDQP